jgi:opacity protein-like surface antigen
MKKILILAVSVCTYTSSFAQKAASDTAKSSSFIGLTIGYAHAGGNFTKADYENDKAGFANSAGLNFGLEGAYYLTKNIGIGGVFSNSSFYTKGKQALADGYKEDFDVDSTTVTDKGKYSTNNFLIGPYFSFPMKKFTIDTRVVVGLTTAKTPEFRVDLEDQADATFYQKSAKASTFGFQAGVGIRYSIVKNLCVKLNVDYFYSKPDFKITNENRVNNAGRLIAEYKEPISGVLLNFGIAYQLK